MRGLLDELVDRLRTFVADENQTLLLVVEASDAANGLVVKSMETIDEESVDLFWLFADDFVTDADFTNAVATRLHQRRDLANRALAKAGEPRWPELPRETFDRSVAPIARMRAMMLYARGLSPNLEEARLVWGLFPSHVRDPAGYRAFVLGLLVHTFPGPWCHHMRVLARDDPSHPALRDAENVLHGAARFVPRLSTQDMEEAVEDQARDASRPVEERMHALLMLGALDFSYKRFADAWEKYQLAAVFFAGTGNAALHALALNGMGEAMAGAGQPERARQHFESALTPCLQRLGQEPPDPRALDAAPVLLNVSLNLGNLYFTQGHFSQAGAYYESAKAVAQSLAQAHVKMQCLEYIGICHHRLGQHAEAFRAWEEGAVLARSLQAGEPLRALLLRQREACAALHMRDRIDALDTELRNLDAYLAREAS